MTGFIALALLAAAACANLDGLAGGAPTTPPPEAGPSTDGGSLDATDPSASSPLTLNPRELNFAFECKETPAPQTDKVILSNDSDQATDFQVTLDQSGIFALAETLDAGAEGGVIQGHLDPHGTRTIEVVARTQPADSAETAALHVVADGVDDFVSLNAIANGPNLTFQPDLADFGFVKQNVPSAPINVVVTNSGTRDVAVTTFEPTSSNFVLGSDVGLQVVAGGSVTLPVTMKEGAAGAQITEAVRPLVDRPLCGGRPKLTLQGQRVDNDIIVGPGTVELGDFPCDGMPSASGLVTISNYSGTAVPYTATLPANSHFAIASGATGTIPGASGATPGKVVLSIKPLPPASKWGTYSETLSLQFAGNPAPKPPSANVAIHARSFGASLTYADTTLSFGKNTTKTVSLANTGNETVCVTYSLVSPEPAFTVEPDDTIPASIFYSGVTVTFNTGDTNRHNATVKITPVACAGAMTPTPLCTPAPSLALTGKR